MTTDTRLVAAHDDDVDGVRRALTKPFTNESGTPAARRLAAIEPDFRPLDVGIDKVGFFLSPLKRGRSIEEIRRAWQGTD